MRTFVPPIRQKAESEPVRLARRPATAVSAEGLPEPLRSGAEALGGFSLADVKVHRNSAEPVKLGALAFARGNDIHLGPGQERHLPHEAWHVVQQKQGRVATTQLKGAAFNQDDALEAEADAMAPQIAATATGSPSGARPSDASTVSVTNSKGLVRSDIRRIRIDSAGFPLIKDRNEAVSPGGTPTTGTGENACHVESPELDWNVVSEGENWRANVKALTLKGQVNVQPWPSNPKSTIVPNTANPVDGGNITKDNFQSAIDDMSDYNKAGGGSGPHWHSTAASHAHEWAHWNKDWLASSLLGSAGGNWPSANKDIDGLIESHTKIHSDADVDEVLTPRVRARFRAFLLATKAHYDNIPDDAGVAGATGYEAGATVLGKLIASVKVYARGKGWMQ